MIGRLTYAAVLWVFGVPGAVGQDQSGDERDRGQGKFQGALIGD
jgi:hypothetical protein